MTDNNVIFLKKLESMDLNDDKAKAALDAIISMTHDKLEGAIQAHNSFWKLEDFKWNDGDDEDEGAFNLDDTEKLFQEAAKKRVLMGLKVLPEPLLLAIIRGEEDLYKLLSSDDFNLHTGKFNLNLEELFLIRDTKDEIYKRACIQLIERKIKACNDEDLLKRIVDSNYDELSTILVEELNIPIISREKLLHIENEIAGLANFRLMSVNIDKSDIWDSTDLPKVAERINGNDEDVVKDTSINKKNATEARAILAKAYIEAQIKQKSAQDLVQLLAMDSEQFKTAIKGELNDGDVLNAAITDAKVIALKHYIKTQLAACNDVNALEKLMNAKNMDALKQAFKDYPKLGVVDSNVETISEDLMPEILSAATDRHSHLQREDARKKAEQEAKFKADIITKLNEVSTIGGQARPELIKLLSTLPLDKQQKLLADEKILKACVEKLESLHTILRIDKSSISKELTNEYEHIRLCQQIYNIEIANRLALLGKGVIDLTEDKIKQINDAIVGHRDELNQASDAIRGVFSNKEADELFNDARFYKGADVRPDAIIPASFGDIVRNQHIYNKKLIELFNTADINIQYKSLIEFLMTIEKKKEFSVADVNNIIQNLNRLETYSDFVSNAQVKALIGNSMPEETYNKIKQGFNQLKYRDPNEVSRLIKESEDRVKAGGKSLDQLRDKDIHAQQELLKIARMNNLYWLKPEFTALAMNDAAKLEKYFKGMPELCDTLARRFQMQIDLIQHELNSLPAKSNVTSINGIDAHRSWLEEEQKYLEKGKKLYNSVYTKLKGTGNPAGGEFLRDGVIGAINKVKEGTGILATATPCTYKDYDADQFKARQQHWKDTKVVATPLPSAQLESDVKKQELTCIPSLGSGKFREFVFGDNGADGVFVEQLGSKHLQPTTKNGVTEHQPNVKLTCMKFAQGKDAKITYAFNMAKQLLANYSKAPSKDEYPIILRGSDPEAVKYIWTALMILGENSPGMKFGPDAVKVISSSFNPKSQKGTLYGYAGDSLYENDFKTRFAQEELARCLATSKEKFVDNKKDKESIINAAIVAGKFKKALEHKDAQSGQSLAEDITKEVDDNTPRL